MTLPDLVLQGTYGRLAWAVVMAAVAVNFLPAALQRSKRAVIQLLAVAMVVNLLPKQFSPAYWIALAFQWPSGLLVAFCLLRLVRPWQAADAKGGIPLALAGVITLVGAVLYIDGMGLTHLGMYFWGFGPRSAPLLALAAMTVCIAGIVQGRSRAQCFAVLGALTLFTMLRLPTGNVWDAVLDPMLWIWAVVTLTLKGWRKWERNTATTKINQGVGQW